MPTAEWWNAVVEAINHSSVFLLIVSPNWISSETCYKEFGHALKSGKKIVPLVISSLEGEILPSNLEKLNWIYWSSDKVLLENIEHLIFALNIDLSWHTKRTLLLIQTAFWKKNNETKDVLLRGNMLLSAESWLDDSYKDKSKLITHDQRRFIFTSRNRIARDYTLPVVNGIILILIFNAIILIYGNSFGIYVTSLLNLNENAFRNILHNWSRTNRLVVFESIILIDFGRIYSYLLFFFYSLQYFITALYRRRKPLSDIGRMFLSIIFVLAIFDVIENILQLLMLKGQYLNLSFVLTTLTILKYVIMISSCVYLAYSFLYLKTLNRRIESIQI